MGRGEGLSHVLQGLVGDVGGGAVDGNGQGLVAQGDGDAHLLALHGVGQTGDLRIALGAIPTVLVVPVAGGVVANVQPVAVIDVAVEDTPVGVGLQGHGDGASTDHVAVIVQVEQRTAAAGVVVATGVAGSALQDEPLSAAGSVGDDDAACAAQDQGRHKDQAQNLAGDFVHAFFLLHAFMAQTGMDLHTLLSYH